MFHALNCLLQRGAHQTSLYYSFKTLSLSVNNISGWWWWSSPASSWWPVVVYEWFTGRCIRVQPRTALTALKWSRQVHGILSWKHFFTDVIIPPVSSSNHPHGVGNGVVQWSRTKPCSSLWMLSFVCAARVSSCIQSDNALKYFRMAVYFVKVSLRRSSQAVLSFFLCSISAGWMMFLIIIFLKLLHHSHVAFPLSHSHLAIWRYGQKK